MVSAKSTRTRPSSTGRRATSAALATTNWSAGTTTLTENTAFSAGSSKHGNARRAWVDSNWVTASACSVRSPVAGSSVWKVER